MLSKAMIREFRRNLRTFSQAMAQQAEICCCSKVSPPQCHAMLALEESGPMPNRKLAGQLQVDASTLSRTVDQLVSKGIVSRRPHPDDRRAVSIELSDQGRAVASEIHCSADMLYRGILESIPADDRQNVLEGFAKLSRAFRRWQEEENRDLPQE